MNNKIFTGKRMTAGARLILGASLLMLLLFSSAWAVADRGEVAPPGKEKLESILKEFDKYAEKGLKDWNIPGMAVGIVQGDRVIFAKGYGFRNVKTKAPVTPDTLFQVGSTSKAFTCTLAGMMVEEGKFGWSDRVIDYLPDFMLYDPWVTREFRVNDLMAQRSGLPAYSGDYLALLGYTREQMVHSIRYLKPVTSFRSTFAYQNHLFLVAAKLVERVSGRTWEESVKERIFKPLGMSSSSMDLKSFVESDNSSILYRRKNGKIETLSPDGIFYRWVYTYGPAGGINSSVSDMTKWLRFQMSDGKASGRKIVSRATLNYLHTPKTIVAPDVDPSGGSDHQYYCQGWVYRESGDYPMVWHTGGTSGCKTMLAFIPRAKVGVVVLSNISDNKLADALAEKFFDMYLGRVDKDYSGKYLESSRKTWKKAEEDTPRRPASPVPPMPLASYAGKYENEWCKNVSIVEKDSSMLMTLGDTGMQFTLKHWDRDKFAMSDLDSNEDEALISFITGDDGSVTGMKIDAFEPGGCSTFQKIVEKK